MSKRRIEAIPTDDGMGHGCLQCVFHGRHARADVIIVDEYPDGSVDRQGMCSHHAEMEDVQPEEDK